MPDKMNVKGNEYYTTKTRVFNSLGTLEWAEVQVAFDFAYNMTFGARGEHRDHRSGGTHNRKMGEIFKDTFQGKISECALRDALHNQHDINLPGLQVWGLGRWDDEDFFIDDRRTSVKSTKAYGNLLLLEERDYNSDGIYIPNENKEGGGVYDLFVLVRMRPFCEDIMKQNKLLYSDQVDYNILMELIEEQEWCYDIPGYINRDDFITYIENKYVIPRGALLNKNTIMDASNYYVQSGDLRSIDTL